MSSVLDVLWMIAAIAASIAARVALLVVAVALVAAPIALAMGSRQLWLALFARRRGARGAGPAQ